MASCKSLLPTCSHLRHGPLLTFMAPQLILLTAAAALLATACTTLGPDYQRPEIDLPDSFTEDGMTWRQANPSASQDTGKWWQVFSDPTLNQIQETAATENLTIQSASARLEQARAISRATRTRFFPSLDLNPNYTRSQSISRGGGRQGDVGTPGTTTLFSSYRIPVDLSYELDTWGKVRRQVEAAGADEASSEAQLRALRLSVESEIAQTYYALRTVDANIAILRNTIALRERALELLGDMLEAGAIGEMDVARAATEVANAEAELAGLEKDRIELVNALAVLSGQLAGPYQIEELAGLPQPPRIPTTLPSQLLEQRPDVAASEYTVAAANARIGVATAAYFPSFTFDASLGLEAINLSNLLSSDSLIWSIGPGINLPIIDQLRLRAEKDASAAEYRATVAEYRETVLIAIREVEDALQGLRILNRQEDARTRAVTSAQRTFDLAMERFDEGLVNFLDVVDAERTLLDAQRNATITKGERLATTINLIKAIGGSW